MNFIDELIKEHCPNGVEWKELGNPKVAKLSRGKVMSKQFLEENKGEFPVYSSQTANNGEIGKISSFDFDGEYITWTTDGANAGTVFYRQGKFSITNVCGLIDVQNEELLTKFVYYFLTITTKKHVYSGMGNPKLMSNVMTKIKIPIPPLKIQEEIVKILDKFTDYVTELTLRQKQYSFYRDKLLSFEDETYQVEWKTLGEVADCLAGATPKTSNPAYWENGNIPWMSSGEVNKGFIYETEKKITQEGYDSCSTKVVPKGTVVIALAGQGKTRGTVAITKIELCTNQSLCSIVPKNDVNSHYLYYYLKGQYQKFRDISSGEGTRGGLNLKMIRDFKIPVPSLDIQSRIVQVLDNFDTVCNDLNIGLPKEIELRQKQYEFFRDKLLTFAAEGVYTDSTVQYSTVQTRPD